MNLGKRRFPGTRPNEGFTLLEALIGMALMGFILAALSTITSQWLPNWHFGMQKIQRQEHVTLGLERMIADVAVAEFIPVGRDTRLLVFEGAARSVTFVRMGTALKAASGLEIVRIAEETSNTDGVLTIRKRAPFRPGDSSSLGQAAFSDPVVLLKAPYRLSFSYAGADRIWRDSWVNQNMLPEAIRFTLYDGASGKTFSTAVSLHSTMPAECVGSKSFDECLSAQSQPVRTNESGARS